MLLPGSGFNELIQAAKARKAAGSNTVHDLTGDPPPWPAAVPASHPHQSNGHLPTSGPRAQSHARLPHSQSLPASKAIDDDRGEEEKPCLQHAGSAPTVLSPAEAAEQAALPCKGSRIEENGWHSSVEKNGFEDGLQTDAGWERAVPEYGSDVEVVADSDGEHR